MAQVFSKDNQTIAENAYRFGSFELSVSSRRLSKAGVPVPLQPKAFDALLCLVRRAKHLVSKAELTKTLWPTVFVSEANLTNIIGALRKIVGHDNISTVSKHGYRFELAVLSEPGLAPATYSKFVRGKELSAHRSIESMAQARDLFWSCVADDPGFAAAWAWLGRCSGFFSKFSEQPSASAALAGSALQRAFAIDPDLAAAHQFYTLVQLDSGGAREAMSRLLARLERHPDEPESLSGLVQVFRYLGLLQESVAAHERALQMDPAVISSVAHTLFLKGEYASAIESYGGRAAYYLDAAAWAAMGESRRAVTILRERLGKQLLSSLMKSLMNSLVALLEGRFQEAVELMQANRHATEPEIFVYFARHYSQMGFADAAVTALKRAAELGFVCSVRTLKCDPWLSAVRNHSEFEALWQSNAALSDEVRLDLADFTNFD